MKRIDICCIIVRYLLVLSTVAFADCYSYGFKIWKLRYRVTYNSLFGSLSQVKKSVQKWNGVSSNVKLTYTSSASADITVDYMNVAPPAVNAAQISSQTAHNQQKAKPFVGPKIFDVIIDDLWCQRRRTADPIGFSGIQEAIEGIFTEAFFEESGSLLHIHASANK